MKLAITGLGKMGMNMARRLIQRGHEVVAFNRTPEKTRQIAQEGAVPAYSMEEVVQKLNPSRIIWLMLPAGSIIDEYIAQLSGLLTVGDVIIDGGNSNYRDSVRRYESLKTQGIRFLDAGISGGVWGLDVGYCAMVGGDREVYDLALPLFRSLAPPDGFMYCGRAGAGHYAKMIHNGIEYGMMQAYAEGFEILHSSEYGKEISLSDLSHLWNQGSVIRSWLLQLLERAFQEDDDLSSIRGYVEDSGEGRWTLQEAIDLNVPAEILMISLFRRFRSRQDDPFSDRVVAALRKQFGGHSVKKK